LYIANPGLNRVEVFDIKTQKLLAPIKVGQLPVSMVLTSDGATLYVANSGGETISVVDPDTLRATGTIVFPPVPFNSNIAVSTPVLISSAISGVQFLMSNGTLWKIVGNQAVPRSGSRVIGTNAAGQTIIGTPTAATMTATPGGEYILLATIGGGGATSAYLYDAVADDWIVSRTIPAAPGYTGPIVAGPRGQFYFVNGTVLNQSLVPVRNSLGLVSGAAQVGNTSYAVFNTPPAAAANAVPTTLPTVQIVDANTGLPTLTATSLEGPLVTVAANGRVSIKGRNLAVDQAAGFAYAITASGLSIVPLTAPPAAARPQPNNRGIVNLASYTQSFAPNTLISIFGLNLAPSAVANAAPLPTTLGNTCVTLNGTPIPLLMTSPSQINAQIPPNITLGSFPLVIHNLSNQTASAAQNISVAKYAPAPLVTSDGQVSLFHIDGSYVTKDNPAVRDEYLTMYAVGLGATHGGPVTAGQLSPASPLALTDEVKVFFGDPNLKQSEVIVDWSGLTPGLIGVYQLNLRVPGFHGSGEELPVTLRLGTVNSSTTGPLPPKVAVD
jgi:uncharacterized protein (TIGR03437 family)